MNILSNLVIKPKNPQSLRDYQTKCVEAMKLESLHKWNKKANRPTWTLASLITGAGKTTIMSQFLHEVVDFKSQRVLMIGHLEELIFQMCERLHNQCTNLENFYVNNGETVKGLGQVLGSVPEKDYSARLIVGTRQSLHKSALSKVLAYGQIDYIFIDECHHVSPNNTYTDIVNTCFSINPNLRVLGVTATPRRADKKALDVMFDNICYEFDLFQALKVNCLVPPTVIEYKTEVDLSGLRTIGGDYNEKELADILDVNNWISLAISTSLEHINARRSTIAFMPSVLQSKKFVAELQAQGINASHIDGETPKQVRREVLKQFANGSIKVLSNYAVFTEGVDAPFIDLLIDARPTKNLGLLMQMYGRGLRLYPNKKDCLILRLAAKTSVDLSLIPSLQGKMITCKECKTVFYKGCTACPTCGLVVTSEKKEKPEQESAHTDTFKAKGKESNGTVIANQINVLNSYKAAWYGDSYGRLSCNLGKDKGNLVIIPPDYADVDRLYERINKGISIVNNRELTEKQKLSLISRIDTLKRQVVRAEQYSLFSINFDNYIPCIAYIESSTDLDELTRIADRMAIRIGSYQAKKDTAWRDSSIKATENQLNYINKLEKSFVDHGCTIPIQCSKGLAAQIITHLQCMPAILKHISNDTLPEITN